MEEDKMTIYLKQLESLIEFLKGVRPVFAEDIKIFNHQRDKFILLIKSEIESRKEKSIHTYLIKKEIK